MIAIRAGQLIDGNGNTPTKNGIVLIEGERIKQVGPADQVQIPPDAQVIDASAKTVLPGLIDVHVHVHNLGGPEGNFALAEATGTQAKLALPGGFVCPARSQNGLYDAVQSCIRPRTWMWLCAMRLKKASW